MEISGNSAEYGTPGGVTLTTRAGNNEFHGTFSDYYSSPGLRTRNPFATASQHGHRSPADVGGGRADLSCRSFTTDATRLSIFDDARSGRGQPGHRSSPRPRHCKRGAAAISRASQLRRRDPVEIRDPTHRRQPVSPATRFRRTRLNPVSLKIQEQFYALPNFGDPNAAGEPELPGEPADHIFTHQPQLDRRGSTIASTRRRSSTAASSASEWNIPGYEPVPLITEHFRRTRNLRSWLVS